MNTMKVIHWEDLPNRDEFVKLGSDTRFVIFNSAIYVRDKHLQRGIDMCKHRGETDDKAVKIAKETQKIMKENDIDAILIIRTNI